MSNCVVMFSNARRYQGQVKVTNFDDIDRYVEYSCALRKDNILHYFIVLVSHDFDYRKNCIDATNIIFVKGLLEKIWQFVKIYFRTTGDKLFVTTHRCHDELFLLASLSCVSKRVHCVGQLHGYDLVSKTHFSLVRFLKKILGTWALRKCQILRVVNENQRAIVMKLGTDARIIVAPVPISKKIELSAISYMDRKEDFDFCNLSLIGRLSEEKGIIFGIQWLEKLLNSNADLKHTIRIHIAGDGPLKPRILNEISDDNRFCYKFHGHIEGDDYIEFLKNITVNLSFSPYEGYGRTILECGAFGIPTVSVDRCTDDSSLKHACITPINFQDFEAQIEFLNAINSLLDKSVRQSVRDEALIIINRLKSCWLLLLDWK